MAQRGRGAAAGARAAQRRQPAPERSPHTDLAALRARIRAVAEPIVAGTGLDLEDLTVARAGRRFVVRVTVDTDGGVSHDHLSEVARDLSAGLDAAEEKGGEITAGAYTLEVSSPGVDRPLTLPRHWRRNIGRLVTVRVGDRTVTGRIVAADDATVTLEVDGARRATPLAELGPGRVQVEFNRLADADFGDDGYDEIEDHNEDDEDDEYDGDDETGDGPGEGEVGA